MEGAVGRSEDGAGVRPEAALRDAGKQGEAGRPGLEDVHRRYSAAVLPRRVVHHGGDHVVAVSRGDAVEHALGVREELHARHWGREGRGDEKERGGQEGWGGVG